MRGCGSGKVCALPGWSEIEFYHSFVARILVEHHIEGAAATHGVFRETEMRAVGSPHHKVAESGGESGKSGFIGSLCGYRIELGIVVEAEAHGSTLHSASYGIDDTHTGCIDRGIVGCDIDAGIDAVAREHLLRTVVAAEGVGVHEHSTRSRSVKPSQVE